MPSRITTISLFYTVAVPAVRIGFATWMTVTSTQFGHQRLRALNAKTNIAEPNCASTAPRLLRCQQPLGCAYQTVQFERRAGMHPLQMIYSTGIRLSLA